MPNNSKPPSSSELVSQRQILAIRRQLLALRLETRELRRNWLRRKYNPSQPRAPAGTPTGGQWTSGEGGGGGGRGSGLAPEEGLVGFSDEAGTVFDQSGDEAWSFFSEGLSEDGSVFTRDLANRDSTSIRSEYAASSEVDFDERQTVVLNGGEAITFESTGRSQTIRYGGPGGEIVGRTLWTPAGPEADATIQPAFAPLAAAPGVIALGGAILFDWQSPFNGTDGRQAVMAFEAREFRPSMPGALDLTFSGRVTEDEAIAACRYLPDMQARLDEAVAKAGSVSDYPSAAVYGTYVHTRLKEQIKAMGRLDLHAEVSAAKIVAETAGSPPPPYGYPNTVRIDAVEYREDGTICIYDFKTGRAGMSRRRFSDLGLGGYLSDAEQPRSRLRSRAIVIEVRPSRR